MDGHNNNNNFNINTDFGVLDPYDTPISPSFFDVTNPTLDDLPNFNINNNNNNNNNGDLSNFNINSNNNNGASNTSYSDLPSLPQQLIFNNGGNTSYSDLPSLPQQQNFSSSALPPLPQQQNFSSSALLPLPQQQEFINNGFHQGESSNSYHYPMSPMMQDHFLQSDFSSGGQQGVAGNFQFQTGPSQVHGDQNQIPFVYNLGTQNANQEFQPLAFWPNPAVPFVCSGCQVLRIIIHTNGVLFEKLEIHGRIGLFTHAIHHRKIKGYGTGTTQYSMMDFSWKTIEQVKQMLVDYCAERNSEGSFIFEDPLSAYYEALCTGMDWVEEIKEDEIETSSEEEYEVDAMEQEGDNGATSSKPDLAVQRERAASMRLTDLSHYFHMSIENACKQVKLCPTVVKKICRRDGLKRWPYRKVKSIMKSISVLGLQEARERDPVKREKIRTEIIQFQNDIVECCAGLVPSILQNIMRQ